jgi:hypothetical protein
MVTPEAAGTNALEGLGVGGVKPSCSPEVGQIKPWGEPLSLTPPSP